VAAIRRSTSANRIMSAPWIVAADVGQLRITDTQEGIPDRYRGICHGGGHFDELGAFLTWSDADAGGAVVTELAENATPLSSVV